MKKSELRNLVKEVIQEALSAKDQAHKKGLKYAGYGKWKDKSGKTVAKTINGKLTPMKVGQSVTPKSPGPARTPPASKIDAKLKMAHNKMAKELNGLSSYFSTSDSPTDVRTTKIFKGMSQSLKNNDPQMACKLMTKLNKKWLAEIPSVTYDYIYNSGNPEDVAKLPDSAELEDMYMRF